MLLVNDALNKRKNTAQIQHIALKPIDFKRQKNRKLIYNQQAIQISKEQDKYP
jgi:hypothetical protein